jgi:hypothetical protein
MHHLLESGELTVDAIAAGTTKMMLMTGLRLNTINTVPIVFAIKLRNA